eukprot:16093_1
MPNSGKYYTMKQFEEILPLKPGLIQAIWSDIDAIDDHEGDGKLLITTVTRWLENKPFNPFEPSTKPTSTNPTITQEEENALYLKLKSVQFVGLDIDGNALLIREELQHYFMTQNVPTPSFFNDSIADIVFDNMDANDDGEITIKEWFQWQQKLKQSDLKKLLAPVSIQLRYIEQIHTAIVSLIHIMHTQRKILCQHWGKKLNLDDFGDDFAK